MNTINVHRLFERLRLVRCSKGVSLVEFSLILPVFTILTVSGIEVVNYIIAHMQVNRVAVMAADNASRLRTQMSESYVNQLFVGVQKAGARIDFVGRGRVILSSLQLNNNKNGQWIRWQRCVGNLAIASKYGNQGKGKNNNTLPNVNGMAAPAGSAIMYVEVSYDYKPLFLSSVFSGKRIRREAAFIVRQRSDFSISGNNASTCS